MGGYVLAARFLGDDGEPLFWSHDNGWVSLANADVYIAHEVVTAGDLPIEAYGFVELPS